MRCRDGRLQYPGYLSFFMIAVPMTIILVHAAVGEAIIDAVIPAAYSAILTLGAFLYSKSLAALLITFCIALAAVNYWGFVYRPASIAHSRRKDKLRSLQYEGHSTSKVNRLRRSESVRAMKSSTCKSSSKSSNSYLRRLLNIMKRSIQHGITLMSYRRIRSAKKSAIEKTWFGMNRPALSASTSVSVPVSPSAVRGSSEAALSSTRRIMSPSSRSRMSPDGVPFIRCFSTVSSMHSVPDGIIKMLAAVSSPTHDGTERRRKESILTASPGSAHTDSILTSNSSEYVVTKASTIGYRTVVTPYLLFTFKEAANHLRSRLSSTCEPASNDRLDVTESSLTDEFRLMLDTFYPDGVALSPTEKSESLDHFKDWKKSVKDDFTLKIEETTALEVRMIHFSIFEEWFSLNFSSILQRTSRDRLMECSLRNMPNIKKRLARNVSSRLQPESQNLRSVSFMIPEPLVTTLDEQLSATPQHLDTPLDSESELI
jgi:hypothetical protein